MINLLEIFKVFGILGIAAFVLYLFITQENTQDRYDKPIFGYVIKKYPKKAIGNRYELIGIVCDGYETPMRIRHYSYDYDKINVGDSIAKPPNSAHMRVYRNGKLVLDYPDIFDGRAYE